MKALARMYAWWSGLETDIEKSVRLCNECQLSQSNPPTALLNLWNWLSRPWARIHIDYAGPFEGHYLLIVIDAHSKWIEALPAKSPSSSVTVELLHSVFAQFGLPETVVSDNGSHFVSEEFQQFLKCNDVKQVNSAPYHPSSNGLAEQAIQIVKRGLRKTTVGSMKSRIARVSFAYRTAPHYTTGSSPAKLLLGKQHHTWLDLLKPNTATQVESKQLNQKISHDNSVQPKQFEKGQSVLVRVYGQQYKWTHGTILRSTGPVSYIVRLSNGLTWRRHHDQLKSCPETKSVSPNKLPETVPQDLLTAPSGYTSTELTGPVSSQSSVSPTPVSIRRYQERTRKPLRKYSSYPYTNT